MSAYMNGHRITPIIDNYTVEDVSTAQGMADRLIAANIGRMYHYVGTTTADYVNGRYYIVKGGGSLEVDLSQIGSYKVWGESSARPSDYDQSIHGGVWQSENYQVNSSYAVCKIKVSNVSSLTIFINSFAETSYDYTIASKLDATTIPTVYNASSVQIHTRSFQKNPTGSLANNYKSYTYTISDQNEHFIYIVYRKDSSTHSYNDRGYFTYIVSEEARLHYEEYLSPKGNVTITGTASVDVKDKATAQVIDANLLPTNIKKDVNILGVTGTYEAGGGGGGFKVYFKCRGSDDYGYCRINDDDIYDFKCVSGYNPNANSIMILPSTGVSKIKFYNFSHSTLFPGTSGSWIRWRPHASDWLTWTGDDGQDMTFGTEYTLTGDIDIMASYATCLTGDTLITMADGSVKRLDHIYVEDEVLDCCGKAVKVTHCDSDCDHWHNEYDAWTFDDGTVVRTVHPHRFYNTDRNAFVYMSEWSIGDHALTSDGREVALIDHKVVKDDIRHYTIFTSDSNTYFANGLLSGNRNSKFKEMIE